MSYDINRIKSVHTGLSVFNDWRRGKEGVSMPDPYEIGVTLDDAVKLLQMLECSEKKLLQGNFEQKSETKIKGVL